MATYIRPALDSGLIEMTIPDKPHSRNQRYRLTPEGRKFLAAREDGEDHGATDHVARHATDHVTDHDTDHVTGHVTSLVTDHVRQLVATLTHEMDRAQLQEALQLAHRSHFMAAYIRPALEAHFIEMTIPDKPRSRNQRYRLTPNGWKLLRTMQGRYSG